MTILVTGAAGHVGRSVAERLTDAGASVRRFVRRPPDGDGQHAVVGHCGDRGSLDRAMVGVETVFLVSGGGEPFVRARLHGQVIDAAAASGVRRLVYLSFQGASATSPFPYSADHLLTEAHLKQSGLAWTVLRDSCYLDVLPHLADEAGVVHSVDAGGATAWVSRGDVARCAVGVLAGAGHDGRIYDLTGPEGISLAREVERLAALTGKPLRYERETYDEGRARLLRGGAAPWQVEVWLGSYLAMGSGELARVSDAVDRLIGRAPLSLEENAQVQGDTSDAG